jgi:hypothetical protein
MDQFIAECAAIGQQAQCCAIPIVSLAKSFENRMNDNYSPSSDKASSAPLLFKYIGLSNPKNGVLCEWRMVLDVFDIVLSLCCITPVFSVLQKIDRGQLYNSLS